MIFISLYFRKFSTYFSLFLKSFKYNENYAWVIVTDNTDSYLNPKNVKENVKVLSIVLNYLQNN